MVHALILGTVEASSCMSPRYKQDVTFVTSRTGLLNNYLEVNKMVNSIEVSVSMKESAHHEDRERELRVGMNAIPGKAYSILVMPDGKRICISRY